MKAAKVAKRISIGLFVLSLVVLYVILYTIPGVTGALTRTEILQYGNFRTADSATVYFVRYERVYMAAHAGNINYYIADGVLVKTGTRILNITHGHQDEEQESEFAEIIAKLGDDGIQTTDFVSGFHGIVSYFIDGYENYFTPETMRELTYDRVSRLNIDPVNVVREHTRRGEPLYKISDNRQWYMIAWVGMGDVVNYQIGRNVTIELPLGEIRASVLDIVEDGDRWLIIFRTNRYYEDFARIRSAPATIVTSNFNGIALRNESIAVRDGVIGVYIRTRGGTFVFRPIRVIATDGTNSLVEVGFFYNEDGRRVRTVNIHDEILRRPAMEQNIDSNGD